VNKYLKTKHGNVFTVNIKSENPDKNLSCGLGDAAENTDILKSLFYT
jgi:hypothetical protein